jgi:hypothetical protein
MLRGSQSTHVCVVGQHHHVSLKGLDPSSIYRYEIDVTEWTKSDAFLMNRGIDLQLVGDYDSLLVRFEKI